MKKHSLLMTMTLLFWVSFAQAQDNVTNIRAVQNDKIVNITYDLKTRSDVRLFISLDDGAHYTDTMTISGYVNRSIPAGKNKTIRWQAFKDLGYGDYPEIRFKFVTEEQQKAAPQTPSRKRNTKLKGFRPGDRNQEMKTFVTLNGACTNTCIPSAGFTVGQYGKFGWFVTLMTGFEFDYMGYQVVDQCEEDGYIGDILPFYNPESKITSVSGMAGGIMRINDMVYVKAGIGYGMRDVAWQLWEGTYVSNQGFSAHGVDVGAGLLFDFGGFVLTLDGVTTNFHVFEGRIGLGYAFGK